MNAKKKDAIATTLYCQPDCLFTTFKNCNFKRFNAPRKIAKLAIERSTGARGLKSILEETLVDAMYELPGKKILSKIIVTENSINEKNNFLIYDKNNSEIKYNDILSKSA